MLSSLLAVFVGGGLGSVLRWAVSMRMNPLNAHIPLGTLTVNLVGGFVIGLAIAIFTRMTHLDANWKLLITTGFCGGLTTFSTFSLEVVYLMQDGRFAWALANMLLNLAGSLAMTLLAFLLVSWISGR
ncbi:MULTISPECIES: fluoride efflux transporter CrcB [Serratia]|uniref:fluoride efflux transporter CrcB n=1 Tax=Serratia TaxID=613 RepID=UPI00077C3108|nr:MULTISPECIES: fluoride efflux transporter CrcB [Serratia]CAI1026882.1 chromosome condensation membrane protein [Serratia ficaria]CAI1988139.1 chromosome condensation membrane protein [Serratia ficaria]CAI2085555.1 chromosome condensation membrane protein [Serratia ficaria]CAI2403935.1 chromosome condensation membrane protein [Serratia ficaria]CAI2412025.1 chromosome condensation membrane protein [Serratia ficaria]